METINSQIERVEKMIMETAGSTSGWRSIELEYGTLLHQIHDYISEQPGSLNLGGKLTEMDNHFKMYVEAKDPYLPHKEHQHFAFQYLQTFKSLVNRLKAA